jgi:hypothetical protein
MMHDDWGPGGHHDDGPFPWSILIGFAIIELIVIGIVFIASQGGTP